MIREWLLVVWLGTSTNFTLQGVYWSLEDCVRARSKLAATLGADFQVVCTQDMREGRSAYPPANANVGVVK
jgi:hypothetical protein